MTVTTHTYNARLVLPSSSHPLAVESGSVTMDEGWAPHVQATLTLPPLTSALLDLLDPRNDDSRIVITATADLAGGVARTFDLAVRSRSRALDSEAISLTLASDEAQLQDWMLNSATPDTSAFDRRWSLRAIIDGVLSRIYGNRLQPGVVDHAFIAAEPEAFVWEPGVDAWSFLEPLVQAAGLRLFCDEMRRWHLVDASYIIAEPLTVEYGTHIIAGSDAISRDNAEWYDAAVFRYDWTDSYGLRRRAFDWAGTPDSSKTRVFEVARPFPGPGAAAYAVARAAGRGREFTIATVSNYSAQPSQQLFGEFPDIPLQTGVIASVRWDLDTDEMTITSRGMTDTPSTAWILAPRGLRWADLPPGLDWTEYTPEEHN